MSRGVANLGFSKLSDAACRGLSRVSDNPPFRTQHRHHSKQWISRTSGIEAAEFRVAPALPDIF
jgi:hypothetical protein